MRSPRRRRARRRPRRRGGLRSEAMRRRASSRAHGRCPRSSRRDRRPGRRREADGPRAARGRPRATSSRTAPAPLGTSRANENAIRASSGNDHARAVARQPGVVRVRELHEARGELGDLGGGGRSAAPQDGVDDLLPGVLERADQMAGHARARLPLAQGRRGGVNGRAALFFAFYPRFFRVPKILDRASPYTITIHQLVK